MLKNEPELRCWGFKPLLRSNMGKPSHSDIRCIIDRNIIGVSGATAVARLWPNSADNVEPLTVVTWLLNYIESYELSSSV